jgi:glucose-1-phosphate thymidylyltransferase
MSDIIGIIPGAGRETHIGGFVKELTPLHVNPADHSRFVVVSERIISLLRRGGAAPIYFVLNSSQAAISDYYQGLVSTHGLFFAFQGGLDRYYGMPFAIDEIYAEVLGKTVLLGLPDTLIEPDDAFEIVLRRFQERGSDLELGLFSASAKNPGGYVEFDERTGRVTSHVDKTARNFPRERANNAWAVACWGLRFTDFIHRFVKEKRPDYEYRGVEHFKPMLFGDVIDAALHSNELVVTAGYVSRDHGFWLAITEPEKYFQALLHYHAPPPLAPPPGRDRPKIFISHSNKQKGRADDLHFMLKHAGYEPVLDSYDIFGGQQIPKRIELLIKDSDYFVLLLSTDSIESQWVQVEVGVACAAGLLDQERFFPVEVEVIPEDKANRIPVIPRNSCHWLDGTNGLSNVVDQIERREQERREQG